MSIYGKVLALMCSKILGNGTNVKMWQKLPYRLHSRYADNNEVSDCYVR